jgi:Flp pilus assembly protein CpaB
MTPPRLLARRIRRAVLARRRGLAAVSAGLAVAAAVQAHAPPPNPMVAVLVAAHDLPAAVRLQAGDLATRPFSPGSVPAGVVTAAAAVGRTTVGPVRAGEPLTDARLLGRSLLAGYPGAVAATVRIGDPAAVGLLRVGDRIDLLAADPDGTDPQGTGAARVLAEDVPVVALPRAVATGTDLVSGAPVVVAVPPETARLLAGAGVRSFLSLTVSR